MDTSSALREKSVCIKIKIRESTSSQAWVKYFFNSKNYQRMLRDCFSQQIRDVKELFSYF